MFSQRGREQAYIGQKQAQTWMGSQLHSKPQSCSITSELQHHLKPNMCRTPSRASPASPHRKQKECWHAPSSGKFLGLKLQGGGQGRCYQQPDVCSRSSTLYTRRERNGQGCRRVFTFQACLSDPPRADWTKTKTWTHFRVIRVSNF